MISVGVALLTNGFKTDLPWPPKEYSIGSAA
jgi:hypothetical protein